METNLKFNSAICTSREQSERLLALGLKKETADCIWCEVRTLTKGNPIQWYLLAEHINKHDDKHIPAWSLHRLIEMMPQWIDTTEDSLVLTIDQGKIICYRRITDEVPTFVFGHTSLYDSIIDAIEKLIKEGHFNKEYLEE